MLPAAAAPSAPTARARRARGRRRWRLPPAEIRAAQRRRLRHSESVAWMIVPLSASDLRACVDSLTDADVGAAAADVAVHGGVDVGVGRLPVLASSVDGGHDLARLAVAALDDVEPCQAARTASATGPRQPRCGDDLLPPSVPTGAAGRAQPRRSMCTVQAPHWARPQPYLVPVRLSWSRSTHSRGVPSSTAPRSALLAVHIDLQAATPGPCIWRLGLLNWGNGRRCAPTPRRNR